jgi:uncharacterized membrane protein YqjE
MASGVEPRPPGSGDKSLGEIVADVTSKLQLLVREEIELAKAEVTGKVKKLGTGIGMATAALVTLLFFSIFFFIGLAELLNDLFWDDYPWAGFGVVALFFLIVTIVLVLVGLRLIKKGSPPAPEMAIEEAKATKAVLDEARH